MYTTIDYFLLIFFDFALFLSEELDVFVLDCSDYSRVAHHKQVDWEQSSPRIVNIDHHPDNSMFGHINLVKNISSVGEMLSHLFQQLSWPLSSFPL